MRCGSVVVAIALAACATHPTGLELTIEPGQPGDTVELYFGTSQGAGTISIAGFAQYAITGATYYAADQLKPHAITTSAGHSQTIVTVEQPATTPALSFVLALEQTSDGRQFAAAAAVTQVETTAGSLNSYTLTLTPVRADPVATTGGPFATVWHPDPMHSPPHPEDECEYFNGRDNLGNPVNVAIVVDTDTFTGTSVTPYADHDCDGFPRKDAADPNNLECDDTIYDAVGAPATLQTAVCASMYQEPGAPMQYCFATAPVCTDGLPESACPQVDQPATADILTNYCAPTAFCMDCPTNLGCTKTPAAGPAPYASCPVYYDQQQNSDICDGYVVLFPVPLEAVALAAANPTGMPVCTGLSPAFVQLGRPGEGFAPELDLTDHGQQTKIVADISMDCATVSLTITGTWVQQDETILLAISPMGTRGMIVSVGLVGMLTTSTTACPNSACALMPIDDVAFDGCLSGAVAKQ